MTPPSIGKLIAGYGWHRVTIGESSARTYRLQRVGLPNLYLKIDRRLPLRALLEEKTVLDWLSGRLPVASVVAFDGDADNDYLLMSEVPGSNAADLAGRMDSAALATLLGSGLRMLHGVVISGCPFDRSLDREIGLARANVELGLVREWDFDELRQGKTAKELLVDLLSLRPDNEDLVFAHGDYCLPNVMIERGSVSGFVDLSRAGVSDRYRDIALAVRSMKSNLGEGFDRFFFAAYGLARPDLKKIEYYQLLDEFF
jgi:kanamycin kinase/aminoglycoside 3'-phosphotransferase-2